MIESHRGSRGYDLRFETLASGGGPCHEIALQGPQHQWGGGRQTEQVAGVGDQSSMLWLENGDEHAISRCYPSSSLADLRNTG